MKGTLLYHLAKKAILLPVLLMSFTTSSFSATVTSIADGNWSDPSIWVTGRVPISTDSIIINTHVYYDVDVFIRAGGSITINAGAILCGENAFEILCGGYLACNGTLSGSTIKMTDGVVNGEGKIYFKTFFSSVPCSTGFSNNNKVFGGHFFSCTSLDEQPNGAAKELTIYPNPFSSTLNAALKKDENLEIILYDASSRKYVHQQFSRLIRLNTKSFPRGIYFYQVRNKNGILKEGKIFKE